MIDLFLEDNDEEGEEFIPLPLDKEREVHHKGTKPKTINNKRERIKE